MGIELGAHCLSDLHALGQSVWLDCRYPRSSLSADLTGLVRGGVSGLDTYQAADATPSSERLTIKDLRRAADCLGRVYRTSGRDGYVCVELPLALAHDVEGTLLAASRLWGMIDRPNIMIKVPATTSGLIAIRRLVTVGINVNATCIYGARRYREVADAYMWGLKDRLANRLTLGRLASVASVVVDSLDEAVDRELEAIQRPMYTARAQALRGKAGVAVAQFIYQRYKHMIASPRWQTLAAHYAQRQRLLWVQESMDSHTPLKYVQAQIGRDTVTAMSASTLGAYLDHGAPAPALERNLHEVIAVFGELEALGISLDRVSERLEQEHLGGNQSMSRTAPAMS